MAKVNELHFPDDRYYDPGKIPRSSDPRDLLEIVRSICRFRQKDVVITEELMAEARLVLLRRRSCADFFRT